MRAKRIATTNKSRSNLLAPAISCSLSNSPLFGIGTHVDIVIKMVECNGQFMAKLSDSPGKSICIDANYLEMIEKLFAIE